MTDWARTAIVAHDAGAANLIFAWFSANAPPPRAYLEGPARAAWHRRFGNAPLAPSLEHALIGAGLVVTGTGWSSDLEHRARVAAQAAGTRSAAVIDHWVNYPERFDRDGMVVLPDAIWVVDQYAEAIARKAFPDARVELRPNDYAREQAAAAGPVPSRGGVLWIGEPARSDWGRLQPGEFQALDYFTAHRSLLGIPAEIPTVLRPHPSEPAHKYDAWIERHAGWRCQSEGDLTGALADARWVVGLESAALAIALASGRTVVSSLPDWAPACRLPHAGIVNLKDLVARDGQTP